MILKRCPHPDCQELMPMGSKDCGNHAEVVKVCLGGCIAVMGPRQKRCGPCAKVYGNEQRRIARSTSPDQDQRDLSEQRAVATPTEVSPAKKVAVYTPPSDQEQRLLDKSLQERLNKDCGYTKDAGRVLSKAEIAALSLSGKITPISRIQHKDLVTGWNW